jgi:hypothetical protein
VRNHFRVGDDLLVELHGIEVWNQQYEGKRVPRVRSLVLFEKLRKKKPSLVATGGVDLHRTEHLGAPLIHLDVETLSEQAILEKLKTGAFTVTSPHSHFFGSLPNPIELARKHRFESHFSVVIIVMGKRVNKILAMLGLSLPKSLKQRVRQRL